MAQSGLDLKIAAPGLALVNSIGNLGGFVSPTLFGYLKDTTGSTTGGLYTLSAASVLAVLGVAFVRHTSRGPKAGSGDRTAVGGATAVR
jgi:nitrate/nitrite transporter NarK